MSDVFVLSEFTLPDSSVNGSSRATVPLDVALTENGYGYLTTMPEPDEGTSAQPMSLYSFPLAILADPSLYSSVRIVFRGLNVNESTYANNEFTLNLRGLHSEAFRIVQQPEDAIVKEGETASFTVGVSGGVTPYTYRWEVKMSENDAWQKMSNGDGPTLTVKNTRKHMDGWKYRCVIADASGKH